MATDWYYRFRSTLRPDLRGLDLDAIIAQAPGRLRDVEFPTYPRIGDLDAPFPGMGPDTVYDGTRLRGFVGAAAFGEELMLAIHDQNLERPADDFGDDLLEDPDATRLDLILGFMAWATVGPAGEVVGCIASEDTDWGHAHPLVRFPEGGIRVVETRRGFLTGVDFPNTRSRPQAVIPETLPLDLVRSSGRSWAELDCDALHARFAPYEGTPARAAIPSMRGIVGAIGSVALPAT